MGPYLIGALVLAVGLVLANHFRVREQAAFLGVLRAQAARVGGEVRPGSLLAHPSLTLPLTDGRHQVRLSAMPGGGTDPGRGPITYADVALPERANERFRICSREVSAQQAIDRALGAAEVAVGDPEFERRFVLQSPTPPLLRRVLDADLRGFLLGLPHRLDIQLNRGRLVVASAGVATSTAVLDDLSEAARRLLVGLDRTVPASAPASAAAPPGARGRRA